MQPSTRAVIIRIGNPGEKSLEVVHLVADIPEVLECHRITGKESFVMRVAVESVEKLEAILDRLEPFGQTTTSLILSSPVTGRVLDDSNTD